MSETHPTDTLMKLLRQGWRGDTATDLMREAADRIEQLSTVLAHRTAQLDRLTSPEPSTLIHDPRGCYHVTGPSGPETMVDPAVDEPFSATEAWHDAHRPGDPS